MSSIMPMAKTPCVLELPNGTVQVSRGGDPATIGLLVERDGHAHGTILSEDQAKELAEMLVSRSKLPVG
jgi:hypothetical protein